ncbi:MAG: hypothetical protein K0S18_279 [Anaerocolumna sp.]|jgi:hypothetical protein|nr:hypothetical protein [Anaerocolumna sp.]
MNTPHEIPYLRTRKPSPIFTVVNRKAKSIREYVDEIIPEKESLHYLTVDTPTLQKMLCCGRATAVQIGRLANAKIQIGKRVLWSVDGVQQYLDNIVDCNKKEGGYLECM